MSELTPAQTQKKHEVSYSITYTMNLGNFESVKVDVGLTAEGIGNPDDTFKKVQTWVEQKLEERSKAALTQLRN